VNTSSRLLPELEIELINRQSARRQAAMQVLREDSSKPRWAWGLGSAALWILVPLGASRYGEGFANFLGLTKDGLSWTCILLVAVLLLGFQVFFLERKVKALTYLLLDDADVSPSNESKLNALSGG
jgi:hypothetical protein